MKTSAPRFFLAAVCWLAAFPLFVHGAGEASISILSSSFSYPLGAPITIQGVVKDVADSPVAGALILAEDPFYRQSRMVGTTGADGSFTLSYSGATTQTLGPGAYLFVLVAGKARTTFVINLEAPPLGAFTANSLRLNFGPVGPPIVLTPDAIVFSPHTAGSTIPVLTDAQILDSAMKLARESAWGWQVKERNSFPIR